MKKVIILLIYFNIISVEIIFTQNISIIDYINGKAPEEITNLNLNNKKLEELPDDI